MGQSRIQGRKTPVRLCRELSVNGPVAGQPVLTYGTAWAFPVRVSEERGFWSWHGAG